MDRLLLFQPAVPTPRFRPGEIVRQTWPWIGCYDSIFPYWQVRFATTDRLEYGRRLQSGKASRSERQAIAQVLAGKDPGVDLDRVRYFCSAVPYGAFPGELWWFHDDDFVSTGLSWTIPGWDDLKAWCQRNHGVNEFVAHLNSSRRREGDGEWYQHVYPPYREEEELVRLLRTLPVSWSTVTRDNFYSLFPEGSRDAQAARLETMSLFASSEIFP